MSGSINIKADTKRLFASMFMHGSPNNCGSLHDISAAIRGNRDDAEIRVALLAAGIHGLRKEAGYIPDVMPLDNQPEPMLDERGWRVASFQSRWRDYHVDWVEQHAGFWFDRNGYSRMWRIPWSDIPYQD